MPASEQNYYEILGVSRDASSDDIRKAYLKLAHQYHPDKTGGDKKAEDKLKRINGAYDTLKKPEKRKEYDAMLSGGPFAGFGGGAPGGGAPGSGAPGSGAPGSGAPWSGFEYGQSDSTDYGGNSGFEDLFGSLFGGAGARGRRQPRQQPGDDIEVGLTIGLEDAADGVNKTIRVPRRETCGECHGSGAAPGSQPQTCPVCNGAGVVQRSVGAAFSMTQTCPRCGGAGKVITTPCSRCRGAGWQQVDREINVKIPAGVTVGARLRLAGEGEPGGNGGPRGDMYVRINVAPHELFTREGDDLICEVPLPFQVAALGGKIHVPTLAGSAELSIPEGTQSGAVLRMRGLGISRARGAEKGDQLVRLTVEVPTQLTKEQRDLLRKLTPAANGNVNYPLYKKFMEKIARKPRR